MEMKTGLVLEGGAMRGIYTAGVLDVFMKEGITFDGIIGVSAGAIHGASFVSKQMGRNIRYYKEYASDWRFMSVKSMIKTGDLVGEEFAYHTLPDELDPFDYETFDQSDIEFYCTVTNMETGKPEYLPMKNSREEIDILRASASMPFCTKPVHYDGKMLLDGGISDSIPVGAFAKMGFNRPVVVLTQDRDYVKDPMNKLMIKAYYHKYPEFCKALKKRHIRYNQEREMIRKWESEGKIFCIYPSEPLNISRMEKDPSELQRVYNIGVLDAIAKLEEMKKFLKLEA